MKTSPPSLKSSLPASSCEPSSALYPRQISAEWTLATCTTQGAPFLIRPLRTDDRDREIAFIESLSEDSRYFRMLSPEKLLPSYVVNQLMDTDGDKRMAFVATTGAGCRERFIGVVRYGADADALDAELGIAVADDWQRQGIATKLISHLRQYAQSRGIERLTGMVLAKNGRMLGLAKQLRFRTNYGKDGLVHIELDVVPQPPHVSSQKSLHKCLTPDFSCDVS
ncbi:MAG TPA: GNAT family N-acetyltransferase [Steroidobacteraceae bacterium]|nr:GNAT family N-acetyltransferase [Steroidobacteraceae bacterium]